MTSRIRVRRRSSETGEGGKRRAGNRIDDDPFPALFAETHPLPADNTKRHYWLRPGQLTSRAK
jgi:hypothetical protein